MNSNKNPKLGRNKGHKNTVLRNLLNSLVIFEHMKTTSARSKAVLREFDHLVNIAKGENKLLAERTISKMIFDKSAIMKVMEVFAKRFENDKFGYINVFKLPRRRGDNSEMVMMMVKGYVYKDLGKKKAEAKAKKLLKTEKKEVNLESVSNIASKSQVDARTMQGKSKSRSGI